MLEKQDFPWIYNEQKCTDSFQYFSETMFYTHIPASTAVKTSSISTNCYIKMMLTLADNNKTNVYSVQGLRVPRQQPVFCSFSAVKT